MKRDCSQRAALLGEQSFFQAQLAEDYFSQIRAVEEQIFCLIEFNSEDHEPLPVQVLRDRVQLLLVEVLRLEALARPKTELADAYNKLVIEFQVCIYKLKALPECEVLTTGKELLRAFTERRFELDEAYDQLAPQHLPAQVPAHRSPPTSTAVV
ncbi:hypothetical protein [Candidatus Cyanaurora vandensis]|uniref:hypothetical protein n=1 Tax=Candidatus Cyanaurora vandensis TaxID=2714958 RepID=UPI00257CEF79|nr:hypothetical protein [Candidatus Cyanaurora vandensis]